MPDRQDIVELTSVTSSPAPSVPSGATPGSTSDRTFLRLWFACSSQYARAYKSDDGTAYTGRCPTCHKCIRFQIGEGGTSQRSFTVSCR